MVTMKKYAILTILLLVAAPCYSQTWGSNPELNAIESYYVKSLNEFIHRFNADEIPPFISAQGDSNIREKCVIALFNLEKIPNIDSPEVRSVLQFVSAVCDSNIFLNLNSSGLYAEAQCVFKYKKQEIVLNLVLVYENIRDDYFRWTLAGVNGLVESGLLDTLHDGYINPVQHELRFSELSSVFPQMSRYISKNQSINPLSFLSGLAGSGTLQLESCQSVTYYFTQIPGYVFSVALHPRLGMNAGWLIRDLYEVDNSVKQIFINKLLGK